MWCAYEKLVECEKDIDVEAVFSVSDNIPTISVNNMVQNNPLGPCSTSEIYNAHKSNMQTDMNQKMDTENQMYG
jgi:hypothetical protein